MNRNTLLGLIFIGILLSAKLVFIPWLDDVANKRMQIEQLNYTNSKLSNLSERKVKAESSSLSAQKSEELVYQKAFNGDNLSLVSANVLSQIKLLAKQSGVTLKNQSLGELKPGVIDILPVSTFVEGDLLSVSLFISSLETGEQWFMVNQATIAKSKRDEKLRVNLQLLVMVMIND